MPCPRCDTDTRPGQKFCAECGLALATACPNCGTPYEGSPKFCAECGHTLANGTTQRTTPAAGAAPGASRALPAAERRFVTILFADLVGFTTLSEDSDPEEVRDLLSRYFDVARETIEGYGGTVEKFIGDAVMAVWGAPVALEDDPERAVRAALDLVDVVGRLSLRGEGLALRAGVLSGEAAVTPGRVGEGMVAGDVVNTASRLQSVAPAGVVLVGDTTQKATSAAIAYEPAGEQLLKGRSAPVEAWRALRVVARVGGAGRDEALEPPFVGRDEEFRLLKDQLHAAERERKLRLVAITGQAGMGKSRLVWELEKYLDGLAGPILYYWHQGRSPAYGEGVTYWALGEMVRRRAGIAESEDEPSTRAKLRSILEDFIPDLDERRWLEPALGALLGIDTADWDAREQLFSAWRTFFERVADRGPAVLVFEDIQWADGGLLEFVEHLLEWTRDRPILIVTLARPEILERRPNFGMSHRAFIALHLEPLTDEAMRELLRGLVPALPEDDLERIVDRAEGVPLYAVETVRALVDAGHLVRRRDVYEPAGPLPTLDIPPSLRALIASRLDALDAEDRAVVQDAAVVGLVFALPTIAALSNRTQADAEAVLRRLAARELVALETDPRSPERGQYRFTQGLLREIAYGTLSKRDRRARHLGAARYFETLGDEELASVLAHHYSEAYRAAPEGEEGAAVGAQARVALRAAAERASRLHSHEQAMALVEQAIAVTTDEAERMAMRVQAADSAVSVGLIEHAEQHYRAAIDWYRGRGERARATQVSASLARILLISSRIDDAMEVISRALTQLPAQAPEGAMGLYGELARVHLFRDEPDRALEAISRALEPAEKGGSLVHTLHLLITKSWALAGLRRAREATALLIGAMHLADEAGAPSARTRARFNLSGYLTSHDPRYGLRVALEGIAIARQFGEAVAAANLSGNAASNALLLGDLDQVDALEQGVERLHLPMSLGVHGYAAIVAALRGDSDGAARRVAIFREAAAGSTSAQDRAAVLYIDGMIGFAEGRLDDARRHARECQQIYSGGDGPQAVVLAARASALLGDLEGLRADRETLAENVVFGSWVARALPEIDAAIAALDGNADEALATYRRVIDDWRAANLRLDLALALLTRARLLAHADPDASAGRDEARALLTEIGAAGLIDRIEAAHPPLDRSATPSPSDTSPVAVARR